MSEGLRQWLENIGLGQYEEIFAANDVDFDLLPELGDEDLKELGLSLGHRRRLQRALPRHPPALLRRPPSLSRHRHRVSPQSGGS